MKKLLFLTILGLALATTLLVCKSNPTEGPNDLSGETNIPLNTVGNTYYSSVYLGDTYVQIQDSMSVVSNDNGFVTYKVWADLSAYPFVKDIIPAARFDSKGNLNTTVHFKSTANGIQDYRLADSDWSKPFTIIKYGANVGDKYEFVKDGQTITRTVTQKSTTDDFGYGFMYIKTYTTEESPVVGLKNVKKIRYITNHKFGLVQIVAIMTDDSQIKVTLFPNIY